MIPPVKTWIFTDTEGFKYEIFAPTKLLAKLNFRHQIGYRPTIKSIGLKRTK